MRRQPLPIVTLRGFAPVSRRVGRFGIVRTATPQHNHAVLAATTVVPVTARTAEARDMPVYVRGLGSVQASNSVTVKSRVDGAIVKLDFKEGQEVKAGDLLFARGSLRMTGS